MSAQMRYANESMDHYPSPMTDDAAARWLVRRLAIPAVWKIDKERNRAIVHLLGRLTISDDVAKEVARSIDDAKEQP